MIKIGDKVYRNLEEQVQANKNDIERIIEGEELLARLGIKVVGQVTDPADLPTAVTYQGEYGDAYLVGAETPYDYYIFTRPFTGETEPQWFNLGPFPVAGPQGPQGERGPQGANGVRGSQWFSGTGQPSTTSGYNVGDYYINVGTGNIWHLHDVEGVHRWLLEGNIRGPQGPQGPIGPRGPQGTVGPQGPVGPRGPANAPYVIAGTIVNIDELPNPEDFSAVRDVGYLQTTNNHVWIIVGEPGSLEWHDIGPITLGTIVFENGEPLDVIAVEEIRNGLATINYVQTAILDDRIYYHNIKGYLAGSGNQAQFRMMIPSKSPNPLYSTNVVITPDSVLFGAILSNANFFSITLGATRVLPIGIYSLDNTNILIEYVQSISDIGAVTKDTIRFSKSNTVLTEYTITY